MDLEPLVTGLLPPLAIWLTHARPIRETISRATSPVISGH